MVGKLTTVLTKKEAEAYSSQGLHQEALKLYRNLLSSTPSLGDTLKGVIHDQVKSLEKELNGSHPQEEMMLSAAEIKRIKEGWGTNATEGDILICARAFCQVGHHLDALAEIVQLLQKGCAVENGVAVLADCLINLYEPKQLMQRFEAIGQKTYSKKQDQLRLYLLTAEAMVKLKASVHAYMLYRYLKQDPVVCQHAPRRLHAIAKGIKQLQEAQKTADTEVSAPAAPKSDRTGPSTRPSFSWFAAFKKRFSKKEI